MAINPILFNTEMVNVILDGEAHGGTAKEAVKWE